MLGVAVGSRFSAMLGSLVTSSLAHETTENASANYDYKFSQEEKTYTIVSEHGSFRSLIFKSVSRHYSRALHCFRDMDILQRIH
jgi:hypothetical protein